MNERFEANLLAYARGELPADEKAWMDAYLSEHPEARNDAALLKETFDALEMEAALVQRDPDEGLASLRAKFILHHAGKPLAREPSTGLAVAPSWWARAREGWYNIRDRMIPGREATLDVQFAASASEAEIQALLQKTKGRIVTGPGTEANYSVRVPGKQRQTALDAFRGSSIVYSANVRASRNKK